MFVHKRGGRRIRFGCSTRHLRGKSMCDNTLATLLEDTDDAVLDATESSLLRVEVIETAMANALATFEAEPTPDAAEPLRRDLTMLDSELARLAQGGREGRPAGNAPGRHQARRGAGRATGLPRAAGAPAGPSARP